MMKSVYTTDGSGIDHRKYEWIRMPTVWAVMLSGRLFFADNE